MTSTLDQATACLYYNKPSHESTLTYCQMTPQKWISLKFTWKYETFRAIKCTSHQSAKWLPLWLVYQPCLPGACLYRDINTHKKTDTEPGVRQTRKKGIDIGKLLHKDRSNNESVDCKLVSSIVDGWAMMNSNVYDMTICSILGVPR